MNLPSLKQMLSDEDFIKSDFFPTIPPFMEEPEFKEFITQMYHLFHTKACRDSVFSTFDTAEHILSFICTKGLKNFCLVDKRGRSNVLGITNYIWKVLIEAKDFPLMGAKDKKDSSSETILSNTQFAKASSSIKKLTRGNREPIHHQSQQLKRNRT